MDGAPATLSRLLPQPAEPVPGNSFHDRFLMLLAGAARADAVLTYRHYRLAQEACRRILGEQALHARVQAKLHHALLHPPTHDETLRLARSMATQAAEEQLSVAAINGLLQAVRHVLTFEGPPSARGKALLDGLEDAFRVENAPEWASKAAFDVEQRLSDLCRRAARQMGLIADDTQPADEGFHSSRSDLEKPVRELENMAVVLHDEEFAREIQAFRKLSRPQPCKIVVAGEGKRGKSSVLNALLGMPLSPVGETAAHTATVLHCRRGSAAAGEPTGVRVHFHDAAHLERLEEAARLDAENMLLARSLERIRRGLADGRFAAGTTLSQDDLADLPVFLRADSPFAGLVHRVEAVLSQSVLGDNVILADTPALDHVNPFLADLAVEECLEADCVVFVMDAGSPGSRSELELLRRLARSGRVVTLVGVLTGMDRLREAASLDLAREAARDVLQEACRSSSHVRLGGVVVVNARQAMLERCQPSGDAAARLVPSSLCGDFAVLFTLLREALDMDMEKVHYRGKVMENFQALSATASKSLRRHMEDSLNRMPGPELLAMLEAHATQLAEATRLSLEQARQVVHSTLDDLDSWERSTERSLNRFSETLVLRLMEAVTTKVTTQGRNFAKSSLWKAFDNTEAQAIAREAVEEFLTEQREILESWEQKLRAFSTHMDECARVCLASASTLNQLDTENVMAAETERATHFLVQTHHYMKNLAVFATGAAIGRATFLSPLAVVVSAGNMLALAIASPMIAAVVAAVAGTAGLMYHLGREDKRRAAFLERRRKEAEAYADRVTAALRDELRTARLAVMELYEREVQGGFSPALDSLFHQSAHLRLFLDTMHAIRADVGRYEVEARRNLKALDTALSSHGRG